MIIIIDKNRTFKTLNHFFLSSIKMLRILIAKFPLFSIDLRNTIIETAMILNHDGIALCKLDLTRPLDHEVHPRN